MKLLAITPELTVGGSERLTVRYARGLAKRGHEVAVAHGVNRTLSNDLAPLLGTYGIPAHLVDGERPLSWRTVWPWSRGLARVVAAVRPDVLYAQSVTAAVAARLAAPRTPVLVTVHGLVRGELEQVAAFALWLTANHVTAVSDHAAAGLAESWPPLAVEVLPTGVDLDELAEAGAAATVEVAGSPAFCCVARQEPIKGVDLLIEAFVTVAEQLPEARLTIVGEGSALQSNRAAAAQLGISDRVAFVGGVDNAIPYLAAADVVVLPSRREGLPLVALEALGLERPVIATAVGGTETVVRDGETGWLVTPGDPGGLAAVMVDVGKDPTEAARRGRAGRAMLAAQFPADGPLDRLDLLVSELARRRRRGDPTATPPLKPLPYYRAMTLRRRARVASAALGRRGQDDWTGVRIFGYHRVSADPDPLAVTPTQLAAHVAVLAASDVQVVTLARALELLEQPVAGRFACLTFDDGFLDFAVEAVPILREHGIIPTVFLPTHIIDGTASYSWYRDPPPAMTWDQTSDLVASGAIDAQPHSRTHPALPRVDDRRARAEIGGSKEDVERRLGRSATTFCYPAGLYSSRDAMLVMEAGYRAAVTTRGGVNDHRTPKAELRRTMIEWRENRGDFEVKLNGALDRPAVLTEIMQRRRARTVRWPGNRRSPA
jgi:glycosyltransferase involved in cell wall biosynthesis/peptidoglycan/xylan/chitin deacetylase (PgdA/CDA1 family)